MYIKKNILATLAYFDLFSYPLTRREIFAYLGCRESLSAFGQALDALAGESAVFLLGDFYSLHNNPALVDRRCKGNRKAALMLRRAAKSALIISAFPFVKGVAVSGSLSKNFADETADTDFFIITSADRLWIARTFLHAFKKLTFLFNRQHDYCMNYFIDESHLTILEKNIYTATEVVTILPFRGISVFREFYSANNWTKKVLPNNCLRISSYQEIKRTWLRCVIEKILDNPMGNMLDNWLMKLTIKSWNRKSRGGSSMKLHTGKHFAKPDPEKFQKKLLRRYENHLAGVLNRYEDLSSVKNGSR